MRARDGSLTREEASRGKGTVSLPPRRRIPKTEGGALVRAHLEATERAAPKTRARKGQRVREKQGRESLTIEEVATKLSLSPAAVYMYVNRGEIEATKIGSRWIISSETVRKILKQE